MVEAVVTRRVGRVVVPVVTVRGRRAVGVRVVGTTQSYQSLSLTTNLVTKVGTTEKTKKKLIKTWMKK